MAKKTRMGRNLNALLGGATRNRTEPESDETSDSADATTSTAPNTSAAESSSATGVSETISSKNTSVGTSTTSTAQPSATPSNGTPATGSRPDQTAAASTQGNAASSAAASAQTPAATTGTSISNGSQAEPEPGAHPTDRLRMLGVDQITRGEYQPRRHFDPTLLQELADSIKVQGLIQPILVRAYGGKYELIAGERRWRAAQLAGVTDIPAIVREMDDQSVAAVSLIENIQRADLNPLEEATALERLCGEFSMTHQQVAEAVGRSRVAVTNLMRLLELHDDVKKMVDEGELDMGHARALLGAPRSDQPDIARRIVKEGLTVRAVEKLVKGLREGKTPAAGGPNKTDPNIESLRKQLSTTLGAPVAIKHQNSGAGKLEISYTSLEELDGILAHIK